MSLPEREADPGSGAGDRRRTLRSSRHSCARNPAWLAEHAELYQVLAPPARVHGEGLADHMAAMLAGPARARGWLLPPGRAARGPGRPACRMPCWRCCARPIRPTASAARCPGMLAVDAAHLCVEAEQPGARRLPRRRGRAACWTGARWCSATRLTDAPLLHAEAAGLARYDALVRVPGEGPPAAARPARPATRHALDPAQGMAAAPSPSSAARWPRHSAADPAMTGEEARGCASSNGWARSAAPRPLTVEAYGADLAGFLGFLTATWAANLISRPWPVCARPICAPGSRPRRRRVPATPHGHAISPRRAASSASWRAGMAWTIRRCS